MKRWNIKPKSFNQLADIPPVLADREVSWSEIVDRPTEAELKGDPPAHQWQSTSLRFEKPDSTWGNFVNLIGATGNPGTTDFNGLTNIPFNDSALGIKQNASNGWRIGGIPGIGSATTNYIILCKISGSRISGFLYGIRGLDSANAITENIFISVSTGIAGSIYASILRIGRLSSVIVLKKIIFNTEEYIALEVIQASFQQWDDVYFNGVIKGENVLDVASASQVTNITTQITQGFLEINNQRILSTKGNPIPSSSTGLTTGDLWRDSNGFVRIV